METMYVFSLYLFVLSGQLTSQKPFRLNVLALAQYLAYNILITPINFSWQRYLEARYPGFPRRFRGDHPDELLPHNEKEKGDKLLGPQKPQGQQTSSSSPSSGMKSFIAKFLLDQSVGSILNILLFLVLITLLQGEGLRRVWEAVVLVCSLS